MDLQELFPHSHFRPVDAALMLDAQKYLDSLTKPVGSLGRLEKLAARLYATGRGKMPIRVNPAVIYTVAGDHGVVCQNISPHPQAVTVQMMENYLNGGAAINALCRANRIVDRLVDAGSVTPPKGAPGSLISRRLGNGTADISNGPAMSRETCIAGLRAGFDIGRTAAANGQAIIGTGELGIGNSTVASALYCAFYNLSPLEMAGPGSGASGEMISRKARILEQALSANKEAAQSGDIMEILAALGGFELVVLTGLMLSCASESLPLVVDGYICTAAYAAASLLYPPLEDYAFLSHFSAEPAYGKVLPHLRNKPLLDLDLRLGEGTGTALAISLLRSAAAIFNEMATFESAGISCRQE